MYNGNGIHKNIVLLVVASYNAKASKEGKRTIGLNSYSLYSGYFAYTTISYIQC